MPTYQYRCTECGSELEAVQKFTDPSLTTCPECSGKLRKVFNAVGVVFKGSGFYATDSRKSTTSTKAATTKPAEEKAPAKSESKATKSTKSSDGSAAA